MKVEFHGRNAEVTERFRTHAEPRVVALQNLYERIQDVHVTLSSQRGWKTVEIMMVAEGALLRSEERSNDDLASFDKALARLERQLRRYRERLREHPRGSAKEAAALRADAAEPPDEAESDIDEISIIRTKSHPVKPMTPEEAALQMELLGHDFFMFFNPQSEQVELVYRRRNGGYGLIEPVLG